MFAMLVGPGSLSELDENTQQDAEGNIGRPVPRVQIREYATVSASGAVPRPAQRLRRANAVVKATQLPYGTMGTTATWAYAPKPDTPAASAAGRCRDSRRFNRRAVALASATATTPSRAP
jgi:hypothetical protein